MAFGYEHVLRWWWQLRIYPRLGRTGEGQGAVEELARFIVDRVTFVRIKPDALLIFATQSLVPFVIVVAEFEKKVGLS
jgi:hypothetical protein